MSSTQVALDAAQHKKLEKLSKKTGYEVEELVWDALNWYLQTKAVALEKKLTR
jgi:hypothetical protein